MLPSILDYYAAKISLKSKHKILSKHLFFPSNQKPSQKLTMV